VRFRGLHAWRSYDLDADGGVPLCHRRRFSARSSCLVKRTLETLRGPPNQRDQEPGRSPVKADPSRAMTVER
jgi:hypothetical protein